MKRALPIAIDTLHSLALSFWIGGILMIGSCVAPAVFHIPGLTKLQSATVVGDSLRHFGPLVLIGGLVMLGCQFVSRRRYQENRSTFIADGVRQLLTFGALLLAEYGRQILFPAMDHARAAHDTAGFNHLHSMYSSLAFAQLGILVAVAAVTARLGLPGTVKPAAAQTSVNTSFTPNQPTPRQPASTPLQSSDREAVVHQTK